MRIKPINAVKPGDMLGRTLYSFQGRALLNKGAVLNDTIINRIRAHGYVSIYIKDEFENDLDDIVKPEIRQKVVNVLRDSFQDFDKYIKYMNSNIKVTPALLAKIRNEFAESVETAASDLVDEVLKNKQVTINIVDIKSMDSYTYQHSVNVCVLAIAVGVELGLNQYQLNDLAVGALIHDIGKTVIPMDILMKPDKLTEDEFEMIKEHSALGYEYLKQNIMICGLAKQIVYQHHERVDGKGYPRGIAGDRIHKYSKIVAICDVYDALTSDRVYKTASSPGFALEYIMSNAGTQFDCDIAKAFFKRIIPYPVGSHVLLSNGEIAIVESLNRFLALRPIVKSLKSGEKIDLEKVNNVVIERLATNQFDSVEKAE